MKVGRIEFAPLHLPFERRLQTLAAGLGIVAMLFGGIWGTLFLLYIIFYTHHWPEALFYLIWIYYFDKDTTDQGGRRIESVRGWLWWKYLRDYFPIHLYRVPWVKLDKDKNYLFCCFPHGILPMGVFSSFATQYGGFHELFPKHTPYVLTLKQNFYFPIIRELLHAVGLCSASANSLNYLLGSKGGGNAVALVVGGAAETFYCKPGQYRLVLKNRKGFVKIALRHGSPLVPVFSFGETDLYTQMDNPKGSILRTVQEWVKSLTGVAPVIPIGRGYFQYSVGLVPQRKPVSVVGKFNSFHWNGRKHLLLYYYKI